VVLVLKTKAAGASAPLPEFGVLIALLRARYATEKWACSLT
jgi:hypothetical protein